MDKRWIIYLSLITYLSGCISAGFTGASLIYDNYELQKNVENKLLDLKAEQKIAKLSKNTKTNISAVTQDHVVLLIGQTTSSKLRQIVEDNIKKVPGVRRVINQITIEPALSFADSAHDAWLSTKLRAKFIATKEIDATLFKIVTENSVVYLMGTVPKQQAATAVYVASHTDGVKKVVKILRETVVVNDKIG